MKKLTTILILLISVISHAQNNLYASTNAGLAMGENWNGVKKEMHSFAPKYFFVNIPFGIRSEKGWLYESNITLALTPSIGLSLGKEIKPFQFLIGCNDFLECNFRPISMKHYFKPQATFRILITDNFFIQTTYSNTITFIGVGLKTF